MYSTAFVLLIKPKFCLVTSSWSTSKLRRGLLKVSSLLISNRARALLTASLLLLTPYFFEELFFHVFFLSGRGFLTMKIINHSIIAARCYISSDHDQHCTGDLLKLFANTFFT